MADLDTVEGFNQFNVNRPGWEKIKQSLYDRVAYPAAGSTQLTFFATPVGGNGKTLSDTNMQLAGQLPTNQSFLVDCVEIMFWPTTPTVTAQMPAAFGAGAVSQIVNDAYIFNRAGNLNFVIGSKSYLQEAPLGKFPSRTQYHIEAAAADATTAAAAQQTRIAFAAQVGRPYDLKPMPVLLTSNQNFSVTLNWPEGLQAITNPASVFVHLYGTLLRRSQ